MILKNNRYTKMQKKFFDNISENIGKTNHREHDANLDYEEILLSDIKNFDNKIGLDFGCGAGRNVDNCLNLANWKRFDGVDISPKLIEKCYINLAKTNHDENKYKFYVNNGIDLSVLKSDEYDFVMSTIVLQHICVYDIRYSLIEDIYRILKKNGLFSFQMGYGHKKGMPTVDYYANNYDAISTNSGCDTRVEMEDQIINDLKKIGFINIETIIRSSYSNYNHDEWIYVKCYK